MIKQYSHKDIEKWASYSGDRNKLHFDKGLAIKHGLKDVIVQGMLILLDSKLMLASYIKESSSLNFYIKKPVCVNTDVEYNIRDGAKKKTLTVNVPGNPKDSYVTATLLSQNIVDFKKPSNQINVSSSFVKEHKESLAEHYPSIKSNWLILDTLLFCVYFNQQKDDYFQRQALKIPQPDKHSTILTYQVAQNIFISDRLLTCEDIDFSKIAYSVEEKDVYIQADSAYSTFDVNAIEDGKIIFQSSIGCITTASPILPV